MNKPSKVLVSNLSKTAKKWSIVDEKGKLPVRFVELYERAEKLEQEDLVKLDNEIKMLYTLQQHLLESGVVKRDGQRKEVDYDSITIRQLLLINKQLIAAKEVRQKLEREIRLDVMTIRELLVQIVEQVKIYVPEHLTRKVLGAIMNNVIVPHREKKKIIGDDGGMLTTKSISEELHLRGENGTS